MHWLLWVAVILIVLGLIGWGAYIARDQHGRRRGGGLIGLGIAILLIFFAVRAVRADDGNDNSEEAKATATITTGPDVMATAEALATAGAGEVASLQATIEAQQTQIAKPSPTAAPTEPAPTATAAAEPSGTPIPTEPAPTATAPATTPGTGNTVTTQCGTVEWGPAGAAPGAFTSDSAAQVAEAVQVMQAEASADYVTIHKFCPGDDTPNGWVVGSSWTESQGHEVAANFLPSGVCVDYDPGATTISGDVYHTQVLNPRWSRTQIMSDGSATGLKFTVYWTPCVFTDGTPSWDGNGTSATTSADQQTQAGANAPTNTCTAAYLAEHTGISADKWSNPEYAHGFVYMGDTVPGFTVPDDWFKVDYDPATGGDGSASSGESVPAGSAFTAWCHS